MQFPAGGDISRIVTTYDPNNNVDVVTEYKTGTTEVTDHTYDLLDRLTSVNQRGHVVNYAYDDNGNRTGVSASGGATTYTFDARNRLATAVANGQTTTYNYLANGWKDTIVYPNGTGVTYTYDTVGRVDTLTNTAADASVISSFDYDYDDNGNRIQQIEIQNGFASHQQQTTVYGFDQLDRMESYTITDQATGVVTTTTYSFHNSYDRATEIVSEDNGTTVTTLKDRSFAYDETYWLTTITDNLTSQTIDYRYDDNGNTLTKLDNTETPVQSTLFTYNTRNQLINVQSGNQGAESGQGRYDYNYQGMRIRHLGSERGNVEYIYDGGAVLQEVANASTSLIAHYRYADRLLSLTTPGAVQFYHYAALGTTANLSDSNGTIAKSYRVDPYGDITQQEGNSVNKQVFTGQEHDEQTGLIYFGARYYDPDIARFITQDTYLGEPGTAPSLHRYLYAYGNPTVYVDEDGHSATVGGTALGFAWGVGQAIGGAINDGINVAFYGGDMRSAGDYASVITQNTIAGFEMGAAIDVAAMSGGLALPASGALGNAGFGALSFDGQAKGWGEFGKDQAVDAGVGAVLGPLGAKAIGAVGKGIGWAASKSPVINTGVEAAKSGLSWVAGKGVSALEKATSMVSKPAQVIEQALAKSSSVIKQTITGETGILAGNRLPGASTSAANGLKDAATQVGQMSRAASGGQGAVVPNNPASAVDDAVTIRVQRHGTLKNDSSIAGQSHHLNQDAAFRSVIPTDDAVAVKLEGNAFTEIDTPHYMAHESLEAFWNQYRRGGQLAGSRPTNKEYTRALYDSLRSSGMSEANAWHATKAAMKQRVEYGLKGRDPVPNVPGRIGQRRRE